MKFSDGTSKAQLPDVKHKEFRDHSHLQVVKSSELILGSKLQNTKLLFNPEPELQGRSSSKSISDTKFQEVESVKFKPGPQLQGVKSSKLILGKKLQKVK